VLRSPVRPEKQRELEDRMLRLGVREEDLEEGNIRCPGRGGQKLNKTSSGISLFHRPTGIRGKCCESRSQALNRFLARRRLVEAMEKQLYGAESPEQRRAEKRKKQKERRKRRARRKGTEDPSGGSA